MKILLASSEARPFIASGGLADVCGALPKKLVEQGDDCRVILPLYSDIPAELREKMTFLCYFFVELSWRRQYCGLFTTKVGGVTYYFVDNEYYFRRGGIYCHMDDGERFAFFSKAVLESVLHMDFSPEVIHCNDWQTGLVPVFLNLYYRGAEKLSGVRTVFTIHNIQYQGSFDMFVAGDVCGIPEEAQHIVEYDGQCNFMKGGIDQCDAVNTVSPTYAAEILDPWYAFGLDRFLREHRYKLVGILNGIDTKDYDPKTDKDIPFNYSENDLSGKLEDKAALQREMGLYEDKNAMLIGMVGRLVSHKGMDLVEYAGDRIMELPVQLAVLGSGEPHFEGWFRYMQGKYPGRVSVVTGFVPSLARRIYAGADAFLMPSKSEPCGLAQMIALRYGTVPIVRKTGGLADSVRDLDGPEGNGFTFWNYDGDDMLNAVRRAYGRFCDKGAWEKVQRGALLQDFSWDRSADEYRKLYKAVLR